MVRHVVVGLRLTTVHPIHPITPPGAGFLHFKEIPMTEFIRVKDKATKHEKSIPVDASREGWEVLDGKPATNPDGTPLPDKHHVAPKSLSSQSANQKEA